MSDRDWEGHYRAGDTPWDHGEAAPGLVDFLGSNPGLAPGRVLVPGCGYGHDAVAWARAGFEVVGHDLSSTAMERAMGRRPAGLRLEFRSGDFLEPGGEQFDWVFEHTLYCAINPAKRAAYAEALGRWVRPGGEFLAIHYLTPSSPEGPPFPCTREEVLERFGREFELVSDWSPRSWESRAGREWMFRWRRRPGNC